MTARSVEATVASCVRSLDYVRDVEGLRAMARRCTRETVRQRFFVSAPAALEFYLCALGSGTRQHSVVAVQAGDIVGVASVFWGDSAPEVTVLVEDAWQRRGIGTALAEALRAHITAADGGYVKAQLLSGNHGAHRLIRRIASAARCDVPRDGIVEVVIPVGTLRPHHGHQV